MRNKKTVFMLFLFFICAAYLRADNNGNRDMHVLETGLRELRIERSSLEIITSLDIPLKTEFIENLLQDPLAAASKFPAIAAMIYSGKKYSDFAAVMPYTMDFSSVEYRGTSAVINLPAAESVPPELKKSVEKLASAIYAAQVLVSETYDSVGDRTRKDLITIMRNTVNDSLSIEESRRAIGPNPTYAVYENSIFKKMENFDLSRLYKALILLLGAYEETLQSLKNSRTVLKTNIKFESQAGTILISSDSDDTYDRETLKNTVLLIDLGGNNTYHGSPAYAVEGEIRIVIDLGDNIKIESDQPGVGSAMFGIALMFMPENKGIKRIESGDFSQGSSICGIGGLFINGRAELTSGSFSQAASAFGSSFFIHESAGGSTCTLKMMGQGLGYVKGCSLFYVKGDGLNISGGLNVADPRGKKAAISLSQGMGMGPRALSGGGIGLALLEVNDSIIKANHMTQGCGYWHSAGMFSMKGDRNTLLARRYDKGTGVHAGIGAMLLDGDDNKLINWGVGPAYGWDLGIGLNITNGNGNYFQTDWGANKGEYGGRSLSMIRGHSNRFNLPDYASGSLRRNKPGYALCVIEGDKNYLRVKWEGRSSLELMHNPWGKLIAEDIEAEKTMPEFEYYWPDVPRSKKINSSLFYEKLLTLGSAGRSERISGLMDLASFSNSDPLTVRRAQLSLISSSDNDIEQIIELFSFLRIEDIAVLRASILSLGDIAVDKIKERIVSSDISDQIMLTGLLRYMKCSQAVSFLLELTYEEDWRLKRAAVESLGGILSSEGGATPGRIKQIGFLVELCKYDQPFTQDSEYEKALIKNMGEAGIHDLYSILSLKGSVPPEIRIGIFNGSPGIFGQVRPEGFRVFFEYIMKKREAYLQVFQKELEDRSNAAVKVKSRLLELCRSSDPRIRCSALTSLGQLGGRFLEDKNIDQLAEYIEDPVSCVRESSAQSLVKLMPESKQTIAKIIDNGTGLSREHLAAALFYGYDPGLSGIMNALLEDEDKKTVITALSSLRHFTEASGTELKHFKRRLKILYRLKRNPEFRKMIIYHDLLQNN